MSKLFEYAYENGKKVISIYGDESRKVVKRDGKLYIDFEDCLMQADGMNESEWRIAK